MSDEWQLRKDVDRLKNDVYDFKDGSLRIVPFMEDSPLVNIGTNSSDVGTLDGIVKYYRLDEIDERIIEIIDEGGEIDLSKYVKKTELIENYDVDLDFQFGISGRDKSITITTSIVEKTSNNKIINISGDGE